MLVMQPIIQRDKFNVIIPLTNDTRNYSSIIKNYLENYIETNSRVYNLDYISQIVWNAKVDTNKRIEIVKEILDNRLIHNRTNIRKSIQKDMFDISSLNKILVNYDNKLTHILNILELSIDIKKIFISKIFTDPILVNYLESILLSMDNDSIDDIKILSELIKSLTNDFVWFLKLIGTVLKNNLVIINIAIPEKYKIKYELNYIINYIIKITKIYNFVADSIKIITTPIYEILHDTILKMITLCDIDELSRFIMNQFKIIKSAISCDLVGINKHINNYIMNITSTHEINYDTLYSLLKLMAVCIKMNIMRPHVIRFDNKNVLDLVLNIIHNNININNQYVTNIMATLRYVSINNEEYFFDGYHKLLIERMLSNECNLYNENQVINEIKILFPKYVMKLNKVYNDVIVSKQNIFEYETKYNLYHFNTITTSYANWNINYNEGYVSISNSVPSYHELMSYISHYQIYYNKIYNDMRKLIWLLQYGEVNIIYNSQEIKLLPIQLLVLELFNFKDIISMNEIKLSSFFNNYSVKFKEDIIQSLVNGNILDKNINDMFKLSTTNNINSNLIDVYLNNNICVVVFDEVELAHTQIDIIKSVINHHVKVTPKTKQELYSLIQNDIKQFKVTETLYEDALSVMIKMDYIINESDTYIKCIY